MRQKLFTEEQIVAILKEATSSHSVQPVVRKHGIAKTTFYRWKATYGGAPEATLAKATEEESARLKRVVADLSLDTVLRREVQGRNW